MLVNKVQMLKIGLSLSFLCVLIACQDVKKTQTAASAHEQEQKQVHTESVASAAISEHPASAAKVIEIEPKIQSKAEGKAEIPQVIQDYVAQLQRDCKPKEKMPLKNAVHLIDVWGDERPESLIEADDLICYEYVSDRGHGGRDLALFATLESGETKQVLSHVMFDYRIEKTQPKAKIYLGVGGGFCGQNMDEISRSEAISCERLLEWDVKSQQFILGKMLLDSPSSSVQASLSEE